LGFSFNNTDTIKTASLVGKNHGFFRDIFQQFKALLGGYNLPLKISWNDSVLRIFTNINFGSDIKETQDASLVYKDGSIELIQSKSGRQPNWNDFKKAVETKVSYLKSFSDYELLITAQLPEIKDDETDLAMKKTSELLNGAPYFLSFGDKTWSIESDLLASWFKFVPVYDQSDKNNKILGIDIDESLIANYLLNIVPEVNRLPQDARLTFKNNVLAINKESISGVELLIEDSASQIKKDIFGGVPRITLIAKTTPAKISKNTLGNLGIEKLIGEGTSDYSGSSLSRIINIQIGSSKFDEYLIKPEEEFSFNTILGDITSAEGYLPGLVIKNNQLIPEYGGGICQVSTTMFRAAVNSGLEITERYPHSFPVIYYNPQGFDATIYPPHPDLRFINNTSGYVLIQREIVGNKLTFQMYGKDEGRVVKIKGPTVFERNAEEDSFKTVLWQEVYDKDGNQILKKGFWSYYQSPSLFPVATTTPVTPPAPQEQSISTNPQ
jgi:vancomycin resistance protein YoaR